MRSEICLFIHVLWGGVLAKIEFHNSENLEVVKSGPIKFSGFCVFSYLPVKYNCPNINL